MSRTLVQWKGLRQRNRSLNCSVSCSPGSSRLVLRSWRWYEGWANIQRVSKALEATNVVGDTYKYASVVAEFELLFHEIGAITNLLNYLTTNQYVRHDECHLQHALYTSRRQPECREATQLCSSATESVLTRSWYTCATTQHFHKTGSWPRSGCSSAEVLRKWWSLSTVHTDRNGLSTRQRKSAQTSQNVTCPSLLIINKRHQMLSWKKRDTNDVAEA